MSLREKAEKVAEILREKVENFPSPFQEWPPHPDVLYDQTIAIPCMLQSFLQILLSKKKTDSARVMRLATSIGQDVIYVHSKGKKQTIKYLQLGIITKRQTGSRFQVSTGGSTLWAMMKSIMWKLTLPKFKLNENLFVPSFQVLSYSLHLLLLYTTTVTTILKLLFNVQMES